MKNDTHTHIHKDSLEEQTHTEARVSLARSIVRGAGPAEPELIVLSGNTNAARAESLARARPKERKKERGRHQMFRGR